jgi:aspartyl-tRNA(Asn)/glutamyl-tRNA(Gln) amidotransferase subunit A
LSEAVETALARIAEWQPVTNAFSQIYGEEARAGNPRPGPLSGVPVAVKDLFDVAGYETTGCSKAFAGNVATVDAELVRKLRGAGAVIVGKTNMHELAMGGTNLISACGPTCNPWDPARITGGSSGGSAAAVATDCVPIALGTDTGGSIRNPCVLCGCWGLKPTHGRLSLQGVMPLAPSLDAAGPLAASAKDLDLAWRVLSGSDGAGALPARAGVLGGFFASHVHSDIRAAIDAVREGLERIGVEVIGLDGDGVDFAFEAWTDFVCMEMIDSRPGLPELSDKLFPRTAGFVARGMSLDESQREALRAVPSKAREWFDRRFDQVDLLLAPSAPYPAPLADQDEVGVGGGETVDVHLGGTSRFTRPVNMAGNPAIAVPAGRGREGLPVGAQLIGRRGEDETLLAVAASLERLGDPFRPRVPPSRRE